MSYISERAALLANMEWSKIAYQHYLVEGYEVQRIGGHFPWRATDGVTTGVFPTFTEALRWVAELVQGS